jgi:hypothetical protein
MTLDDVQSIRDAYKMVFQSEDGERVLEDMRQRFHMNASVYSTEPTDTAYREGQRTVVLFIQSMLSEIPEQIKEHINE